jgi:hypothetical protein
MKFNTTILGLIYVIMICGSHVLAAKAKVRFSSKFTTKRIKASTSQACAEEQNEGKTLDFWTFFVNMASIASSSFSSDVVNTIENAISAARGPDPCKRIMQDSYNSYVDLIVGENMMKDKVEEKLRSLSTKVAELGQTAEEKRSLRENATNPRRLCEVTVEISKRQIKEYTKAKDNAKKIKEFIKEALEKGRIK